jgi:NAD(P)H-nitrite reductase
VIIGAGAAGGAAAEMLRREGYDGPVTLIGADESLPYDRPNLSKDYLAGNAPEEWIPLRPPEFYREQKIDALTNTTVTSIDPKAKQVTLSDGRSLGYGALLLATGAQPVHLTISGADLPHVFYLRTLADSRRIIEKAKNAGARSSSALASSGWKWRGRCASANWKSRSSEEIRCRSGKFWEPKWEIWFAKRTKRMV